MAIWDIYEGKRPKWAVVIGRGGYSLPIDPKIYFEEIEKGIRAKPFWYDYPARYRKGKKRYTTDPAKFWKKKAKEIKK